MTDSPREDSMPGDDSGSDDWRLEWLLGEYMDRLNAGEPLDPQKIAEDHPDLGPEILKELQTVQDLRSEEGTTHPLGTLGDYTLRRQVGRGGMGVVYEAWQNSVNRQVALKVLPAGIAADRRACARFLREAQAAGQLNHQNVVRVYSTGVEEGTPWYSMEYVEGETLAQILKKTRDLPDAAETPFGKKDELAFYSHLASAFADVSEGLQHAHSRGVIHRDIKPSNLILDGEGRLRILDFGLARLEGQESLTISGDLVGTPLYMSPEQARQKKIPVDHRTDIYSLGATMYEALCGRPPFRGKDHQDTLSQIIERDPVEPRRLNPRIPQDLATIVLKCLRKGLADRYSTAEALAQDLRRFVRGDPIEARPQGGWERLRRRIARSRRLILTRILMAILLTACVVFAYLAFRPPKPVRSGFEDIRLVKAVDSDFGEGSPACSADGRELYFASLRPTARKGGIDIWVVSRADPGKPWGEPRNVEELNTPCQEEPGWLSVDGLRLYYVQKTDDTEAPDGQGGRASMQIRFAQRSEASPRARWTPVSLPGLEEINAFGGWDATQPSLTDDECEIFFASDRPGTQGWLDLWVASRRSRDSPWERPRNLEEINTEGSEMSPCISSDGLTLWWNDHQEGDVWCTTRESRESAFGPARRIGTPVNTRMWEGHFEVSRRWPAPGSEAFFVRGFKVVTNFDIHQVRWNPTAEPQSVIEPLKER